MQIRTRPDTGVLEVNGNRGNSPAGQRQAGSGVWRDEGTAGPRFLDGVQQVQ